MAANEETTGTGWTRLKLQRDGAIATVTLHRPEVLHALDAAMFDELERAFARLTAEDDIKVILVTGSDCYQQAFTMGELAPAIGGQHQVIVAFVKDGALLTDTGFARIMNPGDKSGARNVSNIIRIQVFDPPLPKQDPTP